MRDLRKLSLLGIAFVTCALPCTAQVLRYTVRHVEGRMELTSVTVRQAAKVHVFSPSALIGTRLTHFRTHAAPNVIVPEGATVPAGPARARLLDTVLNSGIINPGLAAEPLTGAPILTGEKATPGMAVEFDEPVVNRAGVDVVLFEMQREQGAPLAGDPFHIGPLRTGPGLRSATVEAFDIQFAHGSAHLQAPFGGHRLADPPQSIADVLTGRWGGAVSYGRDFRILAVGIDLSYLGYAAGARVPGLFLQSAPHPQRGMIDPVCLVGLPAPEPANLLAEEPAAVVRAQPPPAQLLEPFLDGPMKGVTDIVFAVRVPGTDHWYANFGFYASPRHEYPPQREPNGVKMRPIFKDGGKLCKLNLRTREVTTILEDLQGSVRDPQVHYSGERVLFSYRKGGSPYFHLYEINADGTGLRQLTDGPYNDIEPTYLPDGGIMFCSDRCRRFVNCWITPVATLHRCAGDGSGIRMISSNIEHDNTPWPLPDGRVLYMRWEYVDRSQSLFHHLWTTNPDGTAQMVFFGNMNPGVAMLDAKPIPGTRKVVASFSPGHGRPEHAGYITVVDPEAGPDETGCATRISRGSAVYRDPFAFSEDCFLVAEGPRLLLMDGRGRTEVIHELAPSSKRSFCHEPRPLAARRRERVVPSCVDPRSGAGRLVLQDVYRGRNMAGVKRGDIAKLLVLEQLPKPVNFSGGPWPISNGGTFTLARVLGTVPVAADGSAYFEVPALRSLFLVALDERDLSVKRMHSFLTVQPGETMGCVGCHERRVTGPLTYRGRPDALAGPPAQITPIAGAPDVPELPKHVQPILDRHCIRCHNPDTYAGRVDLTGDRTPLFSQSYWTLLQRCQIADGRNERGNTAPRSVGSAASALLRKFDGSHRKVKPSLVELQTVRLWLESSAPYAGTYAALGSGLYPVQLPVDAFERRCAACHGHAAPAKRPIAGQKTYFRFGKSGPAEPLVHTLALLRDVRARIGYFKFGHSRTAQSLCNLTRPAKSLLLRAPLAKAAGGLGLCGGAAPFTDADDPDYQLVLAAIKRAATRLAEGGRFDLPGFRPNDYYLHQMTRYGVLAEVPGSDHPIDPYALDRSYWALFGIR